MQVKYLSRKWGRTAVVAISVMTLAVTFAGRAGATVSPSTFEGNDGNLLVDTVGNTDWCNEPIANYSTTNPVGTCAQGNLAPNFVPKADLTSGTSDDAFGQGAKEDKSCPTEVFGSIPPNKSDLTRFYRASETINGNVFLYLAWERTNVLGSANMDFEFNQSSTLCTNEPTGSAVPVRTNGDMLITFDFTNGGGTPVLGLLRWLVVGAQNPTQSDPTVLNANSDCFSANTLPCWGDHEDLNGNDSEGAVNTTNVVDPIKFGSAPGPRVLPGLTFGEASINLTGAGVFSSTTCSAFSSAYLKSRSSASFTAESKDFIAPSTGTLSNCGEFQIKKTSIKGGALAGATFSVTGPSPSADAVTGSPFITGSDGTVCVSGLPAGTYSVTETAAPANYAIDDSSSHNVSVSTSSSCTSTNAGYDSISFTDSPLSRIGVTFTSLAGAGVTNASIVCKNGTTTVNANTENGGLDSVSITSISAANPSVITTSSAHGLTTGAKVAISLSDSVPNVNGIWTVTVIDATHFSIPKDLSAGTAGTTGTVSAYDDTSETFGNGTSGLTPGTYTCTVVIDP